MPTFDTGECPVWHQPQPNPYSGLVQGAGLYPNVPARTEYYAPLGSSSLTCTVSWDQSNGLVSISDRHYTPNQHLVGIPRAHAKGITGSGVKIVVIEEYGYSNSVPHNAIGEIAGTYDRDYETIQNSFQHTANVVGTIAAKATGTGKLIGGAYGADVFVAKTSDLEYEIRWAISIGADIISYSADPYPSQEVPQDVKLAIRDFLRTGGAFMVSAGNGGSLGRMQKLAGLPGVISVGACKGGTVLETQDTFYANKIQGFNRKRLDFALPAFTYGCTFTNLDESGGCTETSESAYKLISNTSFTVSQVACLFALVKQKYPSVAFPTIASMIKRYSRTFTSNGITVHVPNINFL